MLSSSDTTPRILFPMLSEKNMSGDGVAWKSRLYTERRNLVQYCNDMVYIRQAGNKSDSVLHGQDEFAGNNIKVHGER